MNTPDPDSRPLPAFQNGLQGQAYAQEHSRPAGPAGEGQEAIGELEAMIAAARAEERRLRDEAARRREEWMARDEMRAALWFVIWCGLLTGIGAGVSLVFADGPAHVAGVGVGGGALLVGLGKVVAVWRGR